MKERIQRIIEMLEMVEVRRSQNHKLLVGAADALRAILEELSAQEREGEGVHE